MIKQDRRALLFRRATTLAVAVPAGFGLLGCTSDLVVTRTIKEPTENHMPSAQDGLVYALPKGQVLLAAQRKLITDADIQKAKSALDAADAAVKATSEALAKAKAEGKKEAIDYNTGELEKLKKDAAEKKANLQLLADAKGKYLEQVSLTPLPIVPDPKARYIADLDHEKTRTDDFKITVTNGLLSSASVTTTDETRSILVNLAGLAGVIKSGAAGQTFALATKDTERKAGEPEPRCDEFQLARIFDPTVRAEILSVLALLEQKNSTFIVKVDGLYCERPGTADTCPTPVDKELDKVGELRNKLPANDTKGLIYRVPVRVVFTVASKKEVLGDKAPKDLCGPLGMPPAFASSIVVPDSTSSFILRAPAGAFTTATIGHQFKDGMPTEYAIKQPSEVAGVASLPLDMLKAFVSVPADIVKLRVNYDSEVNSAIEAKVREQELQLQLLKAQRELAAARANPPVPTATAVPTP